MAVYGYCRVSTLRQANEGESLDVQQRQLEGYAHMHGLTFAEIAVEEGVSGSVPVEDRPVGGRLFAKLARGDIVIAAKLDRLFRSALDALKVSRPSERAASSCICSIWAATSPTTAYRSCS
jgi:putative DNA-invertase from lambdoid prophage Rac